MIKLITLQASNRTMLMALGDVAAFMLALPVIFLLLRQSLPSLPFFSVIDVVSLTLFLGLNLLMLYVSDLYDQYQDYRSGLNISRLIFAVWLATFVGVFFFSSARWNYLPRDFVEWQAVAFGILLVIWRYGYSTLAQMGRLRRRLFIIGAGRGGRTILKAIQERPLSGLEVAGFIEFDRDRVGTVLDGVPILGRIAELDELTRTQQIELLVAAVPTDCYSGLLTELSRMSFNSLRIMDMASLYERLCGKIPIDYISEIWLYLQSIYQSKIYYRYVKRLTDIVWSVLGLMITLPFFPLIAGVIRLDSPGPVFFRQPRYGQDNTPFNVLKFRTMFHKGDNNGKTWAVAGDPRITRVGRWLRKLRLDELPQLVNVFKGEMSLIGPRAEWNLFADEALQPIPKLRPGRRAGDAPGAMVQIGYEERVPYYSFRTVVRPGITGWAQVMFPMAGSSLEDLKEKLRYDLYYVKNMGFGLDVIILLKTIRIVLLGRGK